MPLLRSLALAAVLLSALACAQLIHNTQYVGLGEKCSLSNELAGPMCKNWLWCNASSRCQEGATVGMACNVTLGVDSCFLPPSPFLRCNVQLGVCEYRLLANNDECTQAQQCLGMHCFMSKKNTTGKCTGPLPSGSPCLLPNYNYQCQPGLTCLTIPGNSSYSCQAPRALGTDCTADYRAWFQSSTSDDSMLPVEICAPGSACLPITPLGPDVKMNCTKLFNGLQGAQCFPPVPGLPGPFFASPHCQYNMTCAFNGTGFFCAKFPKKNPANCTVGPNNCTLGDACAFANASSTLGTCEPYIGGNDCALLLDNYVTCLKKKKCPFRSASFPDPATLFALANNPASCTGCKDDWDSFMCCQNKGFAVKSGNLTQSVQATDLKYPSTGARVPTGQCKTKKHLPNYVVPVIVLGGILAVITVVVLIYIILPRGSGRGGYETINT